MAAGLLEQALADRGKAERFVVDAAATSHWHKNEPPDARAISTLARYNVDIGKQRARQVGQADFHDNDLILAMDRSVLETLQERAPQTATARLALFMDEAIGLANDVPDPYYSGMDGFEEVAGLLHDACQALAAKL